MVIEPLQINSSQTIEENNTPISMNTGQHITPEIKNSIRALYLEVNNTSGSREDAVNNTFRAFGVYGEALSVTPEYSYYVSDESSASSRRAAAVGLVTVLSLGVEVPHSALNGDGIARVFEVIRKAESDQHLHILEGQFHSKVLEHLPSAVHKRKNRLLEQQEIDIVNGDVHVLIRAPYFFKTVAGEKRMGESASSALTRRHGLSYACKYELFANKLRPALRLNSMFAAYFATRHFRNNIKPH